jgi:2',3'-cyclic-nucleotide 2'-phosphodiesterase (5'-nucleotidase family)
LVWGADYLAERAAKYNIPVCALNVHIPEGEDPFGTSRHFDVDGVKVSVIGLSIPYGSPGDRWYPHVSSMDQTKQLLARLTERLDKEADLIVVLCHLGPDDCRALSEAVPRVNLFVGGHTHDLLREPMVVKETGALIVQAGGYTRYIGRLELTVNKRTEKVVSFESEPVDTLEDYTKVDEAFLDWARLMEDALCPDARRELAKSEQPLSKHETARLCAAAFLAKSRADAALCIPGNLLGTLPAGSITYNDVFKHVARYYLNEVVVTDVSGEALAAFMDQTKGLAVVWEDEQEPQADKSYRVVMRIKDFDKSFKWFCEKSGAAATATKCDFSVNEAMVAYLDAHEGTLQDMLAALNAEPAGVAAGK